MEFLFSDWLGTPVWFWAAFIGLVVALTAFDLGILHKENKEMGIGESLKLSALYIGIALAFGAWIWAEKGGEAGLQYYTGFFIEKALSIDNIFVISLIFATFAIPARYQYRALLWGIVAVIVLRGIMIAGGGMPMDAVVSDFEAGAAEMLSPDAPADHWDLIEGQGSIFNPAYAAVSLGLLHGSQPDVFVVCHDPTRTVILGMESFALPSIEEVIDLTIRLGSRTNPAIRCGGVSLNTSSYDADAAAALMAAEAARLGLPVADPIRGGAAFAALVENCLA